MKKFPQLDIDLETGQNPLSSNYKDTNQIRCKFLCVSFSCAFGDKQGGHVFPAVQLGNLCTVLCTDLFVMIIYIFRHPENREI